MGPPALHRVRDRQWLYLGPIAAAPMAHICVSLYQKAKTPFQKQLIVGGVVGSTFLAISMRLVLMAHAGYPGGVNDHVSQREKWVSKDEKEKLMKDQEGLVAIAKGAARGFG
mmetsp:Transcript_27844/g.76642  ORF Transcript_27844/g.76642 Transcript_27844/m.76642 type:complete len:112 (-) Transcript_27844:1755-2090(-)